MGLAGGLRPTGSATLLLAFVAFVNLGLPDALLKKMSASLACSSVPHRELADAIRALNPPTDDPGVPDLQRRLETRAGLQDDEQSYGRWPRLSASAYEWLPIGVGRGVGEPQLQEQRRGAGHNRRPVRHSRDTPGWA